MRTHHSLCNLDYIHHKDSKIVENIREVVFGMQDGMVSTLGAVTGVAIGSGDLFVVLLTGIAIISVESISMGIGSYISTRSERKLMERVLFEEREEIKGFPKEEQNELHELFVHDGWSNELAHKMAEEASKSKDLMLREMAYRELHISPDDLEHPVSSGVFMFFAYIVGGLVPLFAYFFVPFNFAIKISMAVTLAGLFILGTLISKYTKEKWYSTGSHMLLFGGIALIVGYTVGILSSNLPI